MSRGQERAKRCFYCRELGTSAAGYVKVRAKVNNRSRLIWTCYRCRGARR